jgi:hypothetical protein
MTEQPLNDAVTNEERLIRQQELLREAWGGFLHLYEWGVFVTLTFAQARSVESARRCFDRWLRRLEQRSQTRVEWFLAIESSSAGVVHLHALCNGGPNLTAGAYRDAWPFGRASVARYDPRKGARYYLVKEMGTARLLDYDVSKTLRRTAGAA